MPLTPADVRALAGRLANLVAPKAEEQSLLGYAVGAAHALERALLAGYTDAIPLAGYPEDLRGAAEAISKGEDPPANSWLAGYHFNSALLRLAPLAERIGNHAPSLKWDPTRVRQDVNRLKHGLPSLLEGGRKATLEDAHCALEHVVEALEALFPRA